MDFLRAFMINVPSHQLLNKNKSLNFLKCSGLFFFIIFSASVNAANISGIITGDGTSLENATVTLYSSGLTVLATATTPADGSYNFASVADGSYKINTSPPSGSPYSDSPIEVITVSGSDVGHNIALVSTAVSLTGTVLDGLGQAITSSSTTQAPTFAPL